MSSTLYLLLAELTVFLHFLFVALVAIGGLLILRWPKLIYLHLPAVLWGIYIQFSGNICPLTPLENYFRKQAGLGLYEGGFINQYIMPVIYPRGLTHDTQIIIGALVIIINLLFYGLFVYRHRTKISGE